MSIIAAPEASPIVHRFVLNLNTLLAQTPIREPERAGTKRRQHREAVQRKAQRAFYKNAPTDKEPSRQVRRRREAHMRKSMITAAKIQAMKDGVPGGAATIYA